MATTLDRFFPRAITPASNAQIELVNNRPMIAIAAAETAVWESLVDQGYAGAAVDAVIYYVMATATSGDIDWDVEVEAISDGDAFDLDAADSFDAVNSTDGTTVPGTAGHLDVVTVTLTNKDSMAVGDYIRFRVTHGGGSATGDARITKVEIREQ